MDTEPPLQEEKPIEVVKEKVRTFEDAVKEYKALKNRDSWSICTIM